MKKLILSVVLVMLVAGAYGQNYRSPQNDWYRNELFLNPMRFFDGTFALGYQRNFYNSAISLMPSITLMGESIFRSEDSFYSEMEGFGIEGIYKVYFARMPRKVQVYLGPYLSYDYIKEKNRLPDYVDPQDIPNIEASDLYTRYNIIKAGVLFGVHFMWGRFTLDMNVGGGVRYPTVTGFRERYPSIVSVPTGFSELGHKGVVPKGNIALGVAC
jgi:hypothetical protein